MSIRAASIRLRSVSVSVFSFEYSVEIATEVTCWKASGLALSLRNRKDIQTGCAEILDRSGKILRFMIGTCLGRSQPWSCTNERVGCLSKNRRRSSKLGPSKGSISYVAVVDRKIYRRTGRWRVCRVSDHWVLDRSLNEIARFEIVAALAANIFIVQG